MISRALVLRYHQNSRMMPQLTLRLFGEAMPRTPKLGRVSNSELDLVAGFQAKLLRATLTHAPDDIAAADDNAGWNAFIGFMSKSIACGVCGRDATVRRECTRCERPQFCERCADLQRFAKACPRCMPGRFDSTLLRRLRVVGLYKPANCKFVGCVRKALFRGHFRVSQAGEYCRQHARQLAMPEDVAYDECVAPALPYCEAKHWPRRWAVGLRDGRCLCKDDYQGKTSV